MQIKYIRLCHLKCRVFPHFYQSEKWCKDMQYAVNNNEDFRKKG